MRIVITGVGMTCAVGTNTQECWSAILAGRSGIGKVNIIGAAGLAGYVAGQVPEEAAVLPTEDRTIQLALRAAVEASETGGLPEADYQADRVGLVIGTCLGGMPSGEAFLRQWRAEGLRFASARLLVDYPMHPAADAVAARLGIRGPRSVISNACAAGSVAIGYAMEMLWSEEIDAALCGGVDPLALLPLAGFTGLGAIDPLHCSPYSRSAGLNLGEGAFFLLLERQETAEARGRQGIAEIAGYGLSADAYHQTAPDPGGAGAVRAMRAALRCAGHQPNDVDYINGHGTGTPTNDLVEPKAIRALFPVPPPISSTKSMIGHTLGAAGAVGVACCALAIRDSMLPPTANAGPDPSPTGLDIVANQARPAPVRVAMCNAFAFGGNNAAVVVREPRPDLAPPPAALEATNGTRVVITGTAGFAGTARRYDELMSALTSGTPCVNDAVDVPGYGSRPVAVVPLSDLTRGINPAVLRKMDRLSRLAAAVVVQLHVAVGKPSRQHAENTGLLFATGSGPISNVEEFFRGVLDNGPDSADPKLFPNTVVNAAAGHVAVLNRFKGPAATICCGGTGAISALHYAHRLIRRRAADRVVVVAADECTPILVKGYTRIPGYLTTGTVRPFAGDGTTLTEGAFAVLLQSAEAAHDEGRTVLAEVSGFGMTSDASGVGGLGTDGEAWGASLVQAMTTAGLAPTDVDLVLAAATGQPQVDNAESAALREAKLAERPITAPKGVFGDAGATSAGLALLAAIEAISTGTTPAIIGLDQTPPDLPGLITRSRPGVTVNHALVSSFAFGGSYQAVTVSRWNQ